MGKRCFTMERLEVLPSGEQELTGVAGADTEERHSTRSSSGDQLLEMPIEGGDLCIEGDNTLADGSQGELGGVQRFAQPSRVGTQAGTLGWPGRVVFCGSVARAVPLER
jgi:hypothetical protein